MKSPLQLLRDPVWQSIGAFVSVLALFLAVPKSNGPNELAIIKAFAMDPSAWLPSNDFAVYRRSSATEISGLTATYFLIVNRSQKAITPEAFSQPITVSASNGTVVLARACPDDGYLFHNSFEYRWSAPIETLAKDAHWIVKPALLNGGEAACLLVFTQPGPEANSSSESVDVRARIVDFSVRRFGSLIESEFGASRALDSFLNISIRIVGGDVYVFALLQALAFFATYMLTLRAKAFGGNYWTNAVMLVAMAFLSAATAQNIVAIKNSSELSHLHPATWITLLLHATAAIALGLKLAGRRSSSPVSER